MSRGVELIAAERKRQIEEKGFDAAHDAENLAGDLARAAICFAAPAPVYELTKMADGMMCFSDPWPWHWDTERDKRKKKNGLRRLVIAGALIAAEIDRIVAGLPLRDVVLKAVPQREKDRAEAGGTNAV